MATLLQQFSDAMADIAAEVQPSLVQITDGRGSVGAGTVWHSDGLVITNAHVVSERNRHGWVRMRDFSVLLSDGRDLPAQLLAIDAENDLAALAVDVDNLPVITPGNSRNLRPGQWVVALGHPWGVRGALTAGVVIGSGPDLPEMVPGREWLALDLHLRPGHSGGPLVDTTGRLMGINTMISGPNVGFAIPSHIVAGFLKRSLSAHAESTVVV